MKLFIELIYINLNLKHMLKLFTLLVICFEQCINLSLHHKNRHIDVTDTV